jgi:hypothetical protein
MRLELLCPACGVRDFDFDAYEALVLLAPNLALMRFTCPGCGIHLSATLKLTPEMQHSIQQRLNAEAERDGEAVGGAIADKDALEDKGAIADKDVLDSGGATLTASAPKKAMTIPDSSVLSHAASLVVRRGDPNLEIVRPLRVGGIEVKAHLEYFKRQLEVIETVDDAIEEIDAGYYHGNRDS